MSVYRLCQVECDAPKCSEVLHTTTDDVDEATRQAIAEGWTYREEDESHDCPDHQVPS